MSDPISARIGQIVEEFRRYDRTGVTFDRGSLGWMIGLLTDIAIDVAYLEAHSAALPASAPEALPKLLRTIGRSLDGGSRREGLTANGCRGLGLLVGSCLLHAEQLLLDRTRLREMEEIARDLDPVAQARDDDLVRAVADAIMAQQSAEVIPFRGRRKVVPISTDGGAA